MRKCDFRFGGHYNRGANYDNYVGFCYRRFCALCDELEYIKEETDAPVDRLVSVLTVEDEWKLREQVYDFVGNKHSSARELAPRVLAAARQRNVKASDESLARKDPPTAVDAVDGPTVRRDAGSGPALVEESGRHAWLDGDQRFQEHVDRLTKSYGKHAFVVREIAMFLVIVDAVVKNDLEFASKVPILQCPAWYFGEDAVWAFQHCRQFERVWAHAYADDRIKFPTSSETCAADRTFVYAIDIAMKTTPDPSKLPLSRRWRDLTLMAT